MVRAEVQAYKEQLRQWALTVWGKVQLAKAWDQKAVSDLISDLVVYIEGVVTKVQGVTGEDKKEAVVQVVNELVDLPKIPEWLEAVVIRAGVDCLVAGLNRKFGKEWYNGVPIKNPEPEPVRAISPPEAPPTDPPTDPPEGNVTSPPPPSIAPSTGDADSSGQGVPDGP